MKIGIFDSGLGGLIVTHSLISQLPKYDYIYLGDTARVPYGNRSQETIYKFTEQAVSFLLEHDCQMIVVACNTASSEALRKIQQEYLPTHFPDRKVLGVLIPAAEEAVAQTKNKRIGVIATQSTVNSGAFVREIEKLLPEAEIYQQAAPLLVPLIENNELAIAGSVLEKYLQPLLEKEIDTLILGCTHYPVLKEKISKIVGPDVRVVSQDEIIPNKLKSYLLKHPEIDTKLSQESNREFFVTDRTPATEKLSEKLFGEAINLQLTHLSS